MLDWGIDVVLWFQQSSPLLDTPFRLLTYLGDQEFFMLLLPMVYWCIDRRAGSRLIFFFLMSTVLNQAAKDLFDQPRPYEYDSRVRKLTHATGGGLPSGHTQGAVVIWGFLALYWKRPWIWCLAAALMIGIPLSRVYLGVHFPTDLLGGYLIGFVLLLMYARFEAPITSWLSRLPAPLQLVIAAILAIGFAAAYRGEGGYAVILGGAILGLTTGLVLERRIVRFEVGGRWWQRLCAYLLGVVILFCIYFSMRALFGGLEPVALWRFVRYAAVGFWGAFGAPWLFVRLKLSSVQN